MWPPQSLIWTCLECPAENTSGLLGVLQLPPGARRLPGPLRLSRAVIHLGPEGAWSWPGSVRRAGHGSSPQPAGLGARMLRLTGYDPRRAVSTESQFKVQHGQCPLRTRYGRSREGEGQEALGGAAGHRERVLSRWGMGGTVAMKDGAEGLEDDLSCWRRWGWGGVSAVVCTVSSRKLRASSCEDSLRPRAANRLRQQREWFGSP